MILKDGLQNYIDEIYPKNLHAKVMRQVWFLKYQKVFLGALAASALYAAISAFALYAKMTEMEFVGIIKTIFADINLNFELVTDAVGTSLALAPAEYIANFLASFMLIIFSAYIFKRYKPHYN